MASYIFSCSSPQATASPRRARRSLAPCIGIFSIHPKDRETLTSASLTEDSTHSSQTYERRSSEPCQASPATSASDCSLTHLERLKDIDQMRMSQSLSIRNIRLLVETNDPLYYGQKKLKVRGQDLVYLSKDVFKLVDLEVLDLSPERESCLDYKLPMLPSDIGKLLSLTTLLLDTNDLLQVPVEITLLTNLERLTLSNNHLTELPKGFKRLKKLTSLHLANNKFQKFPLEVCDVASLVFLDASDNLIKILPKKISLLTNLETLLLFINQLTKLPDTIVSMRELRCLWLGNNHITALPRGFGYLSKLDWRDRYTSSSLDGNPLTNPPMDICQLGPEAIERFQGVGPNIDAEKLVEEELKRKRRRTIPVLDTSRSVSSNDPDRASTVKTKYQPKGRKVFGNKEEKINNIGQPLSTADRQRK